MAALAYPQRNTETVIFETVIFAVYPRPVTTLWLAVPIPNKIYFIGYFTKKSWKEASRITKPRRDKEVNKLFMNIISDLTQKSKEAKIRTLRFHLRGLEFQPDGDYGDLTGYINMNDTKLKNIPNDFPKYVMTNDITLDDLGDRFPSLKTQVKIIRTAVQLTQLKIPNETKLRL